MTVSELIYMLAAYPPRMRVIVDGYEDGYDDVTGAKQAAVKLNADAHVKKTYYGIHDVAAKTDRTASRAVLLLSSRRA